MDRRNFLGLSLAGGVIAPVVKIVEASAADIKAVERGDITPDWICGLADDRPVKRIVISENVDGSFAVSALLRTKNSETAKVLADTLRKLMNEPINSFGEFPKGIMYFDPADLELWGPAKNRGYSESPATVSSQLGSLCYDYTNTLYRRKS